MEDKQLKQLMIEAEDFPLHQRIAVWWVKVCGKTEQDFAAAAKDYGGPVHMAVSVRNAIREMTVGGKEPPNRLVELARGMSWSAS